MSNLNLKNKTGVLPGLWYATPVLIKLQYFDKQNKKAKKLDCMSGYED